MNRELFLCLITTASFLAFSACASLNAPVGSDGNSDCPILVTTDKGPVCGSQESGAKVFKGIRYAKPPVGDLRWADPKAMDPWTDPMPNEFGPVCPQEGDDGVAGDLVHRSAAMLGGPIHCTLRNPLYSTDFHECWDPESR